MIISTFGFVDVCLFVQIFTFGCFVHTLEKSCGTSKPNPQDIILCIIIYYRTFIEQNLLTIHEYLKRTTITNSLCTHSF